MLERIAGGKLFDDKRYRYKKLKEWLWVQSKSTVILTFDELEKIIGYRLPDKSKTKLWWTGQWTGGVYAAAYDTGYAVHKVDFTAGTVIFRRDERAAASVKIPDVFLQGKVPADAATEIAVFLEYIRKKYGI